MKHRRKHLTVNTATLLSILISVASLRPPEATSFRNIKRYNYQQQQTCSTRDRLEADVVNQYRGSSLLSSTQVDSDVIEELQRRRLLSNKSKGNRQQQLHRRSVKPPLIDSDLLRFLNTTQTLWGTNDDINDRCNLDTFYNMNRMNNTTEDVVATTTSFPSFWNTTLRDTSRNDNNITQIENNFLLKSLPDEQQQQQQSKLMYNSWDEREDQMMKEWMKQYECTYIVSLLHEKYNANLEAAFAVGTIIERMAIIRAQQKRLRSFCKLRNRIWKINNITNKNEISNSVTGSDNDVNGDSSMAISALSIDNDGDDSDMCDIIPFSDDCSNHNNMDEIISVMIENGLSSKDICEILMLSPTIAFMQPRSSAIPSPIELESTVTSMNSIDNANVSNIINEPPTTFSTSITSGRSQQSLEEILNRTFVGLLMGSNQPHELKLRKYDARKVLRNTPGILTARGSESAYQIIQLMTNLGVSTNSLSRDKNNLPILLSRQPKDLFRLVAFLSSDAVRMPICKIGPLLRRTECQDLLNAIAPSRANTVNQPRIVDPSKQQSIQRYNQQNIYALYNGLVGKRTSPSDVAAQIKKVVVNDIYRRMSETAWILRNEIGTKDLGRVIAAYPSVLLLDAKRQILPTSHYLMNELDILPNDLPSILQLYPALLRTDVEQMRNVVAYLKSLNVTEDNLSSIFRSFPNLLTLDIEHDMEPVVEFLKSIGVSNVGRFISRLPPILGYSVDNELRPKFDYLDSISTDARFKITKFPAYFSYPLERVIKSRFEYLRDVKRIPTPLLSLDHVLCSGDKDFAMKVAQDRNVTLYTQFLQQRQEISRSQSISNEQSSVDRNEIIETMNNTVVDTIPANQATAITTTPSQSNSLDNDVVTKTISSNTPISDVQLPPNISFPPGTAAAIT